MRRNRNVCKILWGRFFKPIDKSFQLKVNIQRHLSHSLPIFQFFLSKKQKAHLVPVPFDLPRYGSRETHAYSEFFKRTSRQTVMCYCLSSHLLSGKTSKGDVESQFSRLYPKHSREIRHLHVVKLSRVVCSPKARLNSFVLVGRTREGAFSFMGC